MSLLYHQSEFLKSAAQPKGFPSDGGAEVAFVGRSNAGKSSVLNTLVGKKIARTSKTPGRTQLLNFFGIDETHRLVDLPGYGFAKVPLATKQHWEKAISVYLEGRGCLRGLVLIMDIRHPLKPLDEQVIQWCHAGELPVHVLLNKSDKLSRGASQSALLSVKKTLADFGDGVTVQCFSALKKSGLDDLKMRLDHLLG